MKKTLAALILSTLALLPATSAWAAGSAADASSPGSRHHATDSGPDAERLIAAGCHDGVLFVFDYSTGILTTAGPCTEESISHIYVFG